MGEVEEGRVEGSSANREPIRMSQVVIEKDKAARVSTARTLWVPAINNHGGFGRWAFIEIDDPWDARNAIRASLQKGTAT